MITKKLTVSYPWNRIEPIFPWKIDGDHLPLPEKSNGKADREPVVLASWSASVQDLSLKAGKTDKHAGGQKRQATGATGGKGGQFAKKEVAKDLPQPVKLAVEGFRDMNRKRVAVSKAEKKLKKIIDAGASNADIEKQTTILNQKDHEYNQAKHKFRVVQKKAKDDGYQVNALGKWKNRKEFEGVTDKLMGEAKEARKKLSEIKSNKTASEIQDLNGIISENTDKLIATSIRLSKIDNKAKELGFGRFDTADWPQSLKDDFVSVFNDKEKLANQYKILNKKRMKLVDSQRDKAQQLLTVDNPAEVTINRKNRLSKKRQRVVDDGIADFSQVVDDSLVRGRILNVEDGGRGRSYHVRSSNTIGLTTSALNGTVSHEAGHWLENINPKVHQKAVGFYNRRTQGQPLERLDGKGNVLTPEQIRASKMDSASNYAEHEVTRPDDFIDKYMGKDYSVYDKDGDMYATEIISMGIEYMIKDPQDFAKRDPDYFDFMYATLRGG